MNKKTDTLELDIPKDDIECWERYPKHHWVYDLSRLLDAQSIKWSPFSDDRFPDREINMILASNKAVVRQPGFIYTNRSNGRHMFTELYITKGEIKLMRHIDPETNTELDDLIGEVELRINAFSTLYFQKFTGVITLETYGNEIVRVCLKPHDAIIQETNQEVIKLLKRIYKKVDAVVA